MIAYKASLHPECSEREILHEQIAQEIARECIVLLENNGILPILQKGKLALYGNGGRYTVFGGSGSGEVNARTKLSLEQGLEASGFQITTKHWLSRYDQLYTEAELQYWKRLQKQSEELQVPVMSLALQQHFIEPEIPVIEEADICESETDTAVFILSRKSGEGADREWRRGDYLLSNMELTQLSIVASRYEKCIVLLNVGGVIDVAEIQQIKGIDALLIMGQLGSTGSLAVADVLSGAVTPSGKLGTTWAKSYHDYPSALTYSHINDEVDDEYYMEDCFVGYRYFDSFQVTPAYCFGYGLSYTEFQITKTKVCIEGQHIKIQTMISNTGPIYAGKEVVQVYLIKPLCLKDEPQQKLVAFQKSSCLQPGEEEILEMKFSVKEMAVFDEVDSVWRINRGSYELQIGNSSRHTKKTASIYISENHVIASVDRLFQADASYPKLRCYHKSEEVVQQEGLMLDVRYLACKQARYQTEQVFMQDHYCDVMITFEDVKQRKYSLDDLIAQLSIEEMASLCVGSYGADKALEIVGSASNLVPGAAGDTSSILNESRGISHLIMADGPAGLRLLPHFQVTKKGAISLDEKVSDNQDEITNYYQYCTAFPIATSLAQSWNLALLETMGEVIGKEMELFGVHLWLAPAMNIQRNPLCGRNFEYFSEDPFLTGACASALVTALQKIPGRGAVIKHFAANNQECHRMFTNAHISEKALRELYLKGFSMVLQEACPVGIMTSYNLINGIHAANHKGLLQHFARDEHGYDGIIMTDWFATQDMRQMLGIVQTKYPSSDAVCCIMAGNDLQMPGSGQIWEEIIAYFHNHPEHMGYLQFCVKNILRSIERLS